MQIEPERADLKRQIGCRAKMEGEQNGNGENEWVRIGAQGEGGEGVIRTMISARASV